jgi:hypothetical protein
MEKRDREEERSWTQSLYVFSFSNFFFFGADKFIPGLGELMYASFAPTTTYFDDISCDNPW